jgi:Leucine-rich repeat (LRR) protein
VCSDLGELVIVPTDFAGMSATITYTSLTFSGRTKIRSIQALAFESSGIQMLDLRRLGVRSVDSNAFYLVAGLRTILLSGNNIHSIKQGMFQFDTSGTRYGQLWLESVDLSSNEIDLVSVESFSGWIESIDLSKNRIYELPDYTFANVTALATLALSTNLLTNLSAYAFYGLSQLRQLSVSRNALALIDPNAFDTLVSLEQLDLGENRLETVPIELFAATISLVYVNLRGNRLAVFSFANLLLTSMPVKVLVDRNQFTDLRQLSVCDSTISIVSSLSITGNRIERIPELYFNECTSLVSLDVSVNNVSAIGSSTFVGLSSLEVLNVSSNNIDVLPSDSFAELFQLVTLDLADNHLVTLPVGLFHNCPRLASVNLTRNRLLSVAFGVFANLSDLTSIDLSSNRIQFLYNKSFFNLPALERLDLSGNDIVFIPAMTFYDLSALTDLNIGNNLLLDISTAMFSSVSMSSLRSLNLAGNNLQQAPYSVFHSPLLCLTTVQLSGNAIANISQFLLSMKCGGQAGHIDLSGNAIETIAPRAFNGSSGIIEVILSNNMLDAIEVDAFIGLSDLVFLDLSDNQLVHIDDGAFRDLVHLRKLLLSNNRLTAVSPGTLTGLGKSLTLLNVSDNSLDDQFFVNARLDLLTRLTELVADRNSFTKVNGTVLWLDSLKTLSLRGNAIMWIKGTAFKNIQHLDLGQNLLGAGFVKEDMPNLKYVITLKLDGNLLNRAVDSLYFHSELEEIDLSDNGLTAGLLKKAFLATYNLQVLKLDRNLIENLNEINLGYQRYTLKTLSMVNNRLTDNAWTEISKLVDLTELRLDGNQITIIPDSQFLTFYNLITLSLSGNSLTELGPLSLDGLEQSCRTLNLSNNDISTVSSAAFRRLGNLVTLDLSKNHLPSLIFPPVFTRLRDLNLDSNRLKTFPDGPRRLPSIRALIVSNNDIETLPELDIYNDDDDDRFVRTFNASHNRLKDISSVHLIGSFVNVSFAGNRLSQNISLLPAMFDRTVHVELLDLADNQLRDDVMKVPTVGERLTSTVSRLILDGNLLTSLGPLANSTTATCLTELYVAGNRLSTIGDGFLSSVSGSLVILDLRRNSLQHLRASAFSVAVSGTSSSLRKLMLADNPWHCDCSIAWLRDGALGSAIDDAICWTPSSTGGQYVVCFDVSMNCSATTSAPVATEDVTQKCSDFRNGDYCAH